MQTDATCWAQQCCVRLHGPKSLTGFKLYATSANIFVVPCKRTQRVGSNSVASCWPTMLRPFAWALRRVRPQSKKSTNFLISRSISCKASLISLSYVSGIRFSFGSLSLQDTSPGFTLTIHQSGCPSLYPYAFEFDFE